jgi:hypothetical protein
VRSKKSTQSHIVIKSSEDKEFSENFESNRENTREPPKTISVLYSKSGLERELCGRELAWYVQGRGSIPRITNNRKGIL